MIKTYAEIKTSQYSSDRNHRLVRAARSRGLTEIEITFVPHNIPGRGWWLKSKEIERMFIGYQVGEADIRINQIGASNVVENESEVRNKMHDQVINGLMCPITGQTIYQ